MDVVQKHQIKIPNAVIVEGLTGSENDEEVVDFLKQYGSINRIISVDDPSSEFFQQAIIEFNSGSAVEALEPQLPYSHVAEGSEVPYYVQSLAKVYTQTKGNTTTKTYLSELKELAKLSGRDYAEVLKDMMSHISDSISDIAPPAQEDMGRVSPISGAVAGETSLHVTSDPPCRNPVGSGANRSARTAQSVQLPNTSYRAGFDPNPPEVQRMVVEHIVKRDETQIPLKLRAFSGKIPRPSHEPDYDTWRSSVDLILADPTISDLQRSRRILESVLPPASDIVKHVSPTSLPVTYLELLDSAYGTVQDGDELYAKFLDTFQNAGEKPSAYLQRLQVALNSAVRRGGVLSCDVDKHLLAQFCRGCWDNALLAELQLKQRKTNPPSFAELLLLLRTEEDSHTAKACRMRQYLGNSKQKAMLNTQAINDSEGEKGACASLSLLTQQLSREVAEIQKQLAVLTVKQEKKETQKPRKPLTSKPATTQNRSQVTHDRGQPAPKVSVVRPKPWYCFRCGKDGHIKPNCDQDPDPGLVAEKRKLLREMQQRWDIEHPTRDTTADLLN